MSDDNLRKGDNVEWKSHGNTVKGKVERMITLDTEAAGRAVRASEEDPQYQVRSAKTGNDAGYPKRHLAQRPSGDIRDTVWRHSLINRGHDPAKR